MSDIIRNIFFMVMVMMVMMVMTVMVIVIAMVVMMIRMVIVVHLFQTATNKEVDVANSSVS